jgi:hypothetical protein
MPEAPLLGMPTGAKQAGQRADFRVDKFDILIETKGWMLLWERATRCPCTPITAQTEQFDPNCPLCKGRGWVYFGADPQDFTALSYNLDELQTQMVQQSGGMVIRGLLRDVTRNPDPVDVLGNWVSGDTRLTVRYGNAIGFYDRITALDASIVYSEITEATGTDLLTLRYPATKVNLIRSLENAYKYAVHFTIEHGHIRWLSEYPNKGVRLSIQYLCNPVWLVMDYPNSVRSTQLRFKVLELQTPTGNPMGLPIQCHLRYEFMVHG